MQSFSDVGLPRFHITELGPSALCDWSRAHAASDPKAVVRCIRGNKMLDVDSLFDEFSAALQFPYYFGENWPAFSECINDLSWLVGTRYVFVLTDADRILTTSDPDLSTFVRIMNHAAQSWSEPATSTRPWAPEPRPFHVILQAAPNDRIERQLAASNIPHDSALQPQPLAHRADARRGPE